MQNNDKMLHSIINGETLELPFPVDKEIRQKSKRLPFRRMPAEEETDSDEPLVVTRSDSKTKHTKILCPVPDCDRELAGFRRFEDHCLTHLDSTKVRSLCYFSVVASAYLSLLLLFQNIRCPICRFAYKRSDNFRKHMYVHTNQKFQCSDCERMFNNPKSLNDHLRIVHKIFARDDPEDKRCKGARNTIVPDAIKCPVCKLDLSSFKDYDEHMGTHISREDRSCPLCQKEINHYGNLKKHMFSHTDIQFTCQFCSEQFDNTMKYRNHIKVTHKKIFYYEKDEEVTDEEEDSEFPTECVLCQESISTQEERVAHMVEEHSKEQGLCTDCGMILSSEHELRAHKLKKHSGDWIDCDECDEKFNSVSWWGFYSRSVGNIFRFCRCVDSESIDRRLIAG